MELGDEIFGEKNGPYGSMPSMNGNGGPAGMIMVAIPSSGMGGTPVQADGKVDFHSGSKIVLPDGMSFETAMAVLQRNKDDAETPAVWDFKYNYRPDDGGYAAMRVLERLYGSAFGESMVVDGGMFGGGEQEVPSQTRKVAISLTDNVEIPWGLVTVPSKPGLELIFCDRHPHPDYGKVFELHIKGPKKYKDEAARINLAIEEELASNSIYRGKALTGAKELKFFDLSAVDPAQIVFADDVQRDLSAKLWSILRYSDVVRGEGVSLKRTVLLYGPYGTGKTSAGLLTGQIAVAHGWTVIFAKTGDSIEDVLKTARLYKRCVVFYEDVDRDGKTDDDGLSELLDAFDGATAKGTELVTVLTTNREKDVPQGMLRPGRLDTCIRIGELDRNGCERLARAIIPSHKLASDVDFGLVYAAMDGYTPAFVREAVDSAKLYAITRLDGSSDYVITTDDLVAAAESLRTQFEAYMSAEEGEHVPQIELALAELVKRALDGGEVFLPGFGTGTLAFSASAKADDE